MNMHFSDYPLDPSLLRGLEQAGYEQPTPVQEAVLEPALDGRDLMVCAATGSGKTAAFLLPMMQHMLETPKADGGTRALILVPTRELARQVREHFMRIGGHTRLGVDVITGGDSRAHQIATLRRNPEFLIATPGRFREMLEHGRTELDDLEFLVLDEADRMLEMGFVEDVVTIIENSNPDRQSLLFSATLERRGLERITALLLDDPLALTLDAVREAHPDIRHQCLLSDEVAHKREQLRWLLANETFEKALVFVNSRDLATELGGWLGAQGERVAVLHGELEQRERNRVMGLLQQGKVRVLVATDLAARGIDVPGVERVFNLEVPRNGEDYLHRSGRTGRAGEQGVAVNLVGPTEWNRMESISRFLGLTLEWRAIDELAARFKGPAAKKRRKTPASRVKAKKTPARAASKTKDKQRHRDRKNIGKRRAPSGKPIEAGHAPLSRKRRDEGGTEER
ncbi:RNA helicase [Marichromatium purpuratum 984]|uniref:RNA helicase n=1 Tax=Marichromatium purpuratum 984 TaxID=765910 RepID=W0DXB9_MARPU|nr:DEAD/DEAH box helicase [Marichromatium purpuratum]AHF03107.1 RNA helicase [Marichromatium purpuratum 984]